MGIVVFWIDNLLGAQAKAHASTEMLKALAFVEALRKEGHHHVCMSSELPDSVGKPGVNDVLPEGYDWKKRRQ